MPKINRRQFLTRVGATFGVAGLSFVMNKMGLMSNDAYAKARFQGNLPPTTGAGKSVVILGAGVTGLRAAWELAAGGFDVMVLEGAPYMGGRNQTIRPSSGAYKSNWLGRQGGRFPESAYHTQIIQEQRDENGKVISSEVQTCMFKDDDWEDGKVTGNPDELYLNAGPGRIPSTHNALLDHCRKFDVALEPFIYASRTNLMQKDGFNDDEPMRLGLIKHSLREEIANILLTAEKTGNLDEMIGRAEKSAFKDMVGEFGLNEPDRRGYAKDKTLGAWFNGATVRDKLSMEEVLESEAWEHGLFSDMHIYWQATMMQPVGGMDRVWTNVLTQPLPKEVGGGTIERLIHVDTPATKVECIKENGVSRVRVGWASADGERVGERTFDFCISTMAATRLGPLVKNFSEKNLALYLNTVSNGDSCKVGWQTRGRWFEEDYEIFGGISWISHDVTQMWYPSQNFHARNATMTGTYNADEVATEFGKKSLQARLEAAAEGGAKLHNKPSVGLPVTVEDFKNKMVYFDRGLSIAWQQVPYQDGAWCGLDFEFNEQEIEINGETLLLRDQLAKQPFDTLYLAGDWISYTPGWQEGSIRTAMASVYAIADLCTPGISETEPGTCRYENLPEG